jgi:RNA polymerase sigma-70 factor (ECF subfamily)
LVEKAVKKIAPLLFRRPAVHDAARGSVSPGVGRIDEFKRLILPHLDGAYNLACYLTRDPILSQDIVQDSYVRAFRAFAQFRGPSARAWLFAIVRNCCRSAQSRSGGAVSLVVHESSLSEHEALQMEEEPDPSPSPEDEVIRRTEINRLRNAIEAMPEPFREAIVLREIEELSYAEIAEVTGVPIGTVMSRLSRGRSMLAAELLPEAKAASEQSRSVK